MRVDPSQSWEGQESLEKTLMQIRIKDFGDNLVTCVCVCPVSFHTILRFSLNLNKAYDEILNLRHSLCGIN